MSVNLNGTTTAARQENKDAIAKDIDLTTLDGFQLPADITEEFLTRMQNEVEILDLADTMTLDRLEQDVPQFGVPRLSGDTRDEDGSRTAASENDDGQYSFDATDRQYYILVEPTRDAIKNTNLSDDQWGELIVGEFTERYANDVALIGINAGYSGSQAVTLPGGIDSTWEGWLARAEGDAASSEDRIGLEDTADAEVDSMPVFDNEEAGDPQPVDTELFHNAIQTLDSRYRDPDDFVFMMSPDNVQQYHFDLTDREDGLGVPVLQGENDVTPFAYDVVGISGWPNDVAMFTDPDNLAYGLYREMEVDQTTDTDKVHEDRLHSRNWLEGQFDFQIKEMQAGVLIEGIEDPT